MRLINTAFGCILLISWARSYSFLGMPEGYLSNFGIKPWNSPQQRSGSSTSTAIHLKNGLSNVNVDLNQYRSELIPPSNKEPPLKTTAVIDIGDWSVNMVKNLARIVVKGTIVEENDTKISLPVAAALQKMRKDVQFLDDVANRTPQLSTLELIVLLATVSLSAISPFILSIKVVEVLVPSLAALSASVGISAEYIGKVAVSNGKEFAALAIQAAAESEALLAAAERTKAVLPLCVGIATTASAFALLAPTLLKELSETFSVHLINEVYLICPLIAVLAAAIAGLATQESQGLASRAIGVGNRRFASSSSVGRTWMSATEQVQANAIRTSQKWKWFALGVAPAPLIATLFPGPLSVKTIICASLAAAQAAYYLSIAEYSLAVAVDAVAFKARSAAVSDTYANQGSRAGAILPFTSALAGLCAAASAAAVEILPLLSTTEIQAVVALLFPSGAALFAAAAAVSKARCEVKKTFYTLPSHNLKIGIFIYNTIFSLRKQGLLLSSAPPALSTMLCASMISKQFLFFTRSTFIFFLFLFISIFISFYISFFILSLLQVDAAAAGAAAAMGLSGEDNPNSPIKDPIRQVQELIEITLKTSWARIVMKVRMFRSIVKKKKGWVTFKKWFFNTFGLGPGPSSGTGSGSRGTNSMDGVKIA